VNRLALIVPLFLSVVILSLAVPRVVASVLRGPAHRTILKVEAGKPYEIETLARSTEYLARATYWESSALLFGELGYLRYLEGFYTERDDPARPAMIDRASQNLRQSLRLSPARPHPWVRLAYARALEDADPSEVADLLALSIRTGPYAAEISATRLDLLLRLWKYLTPELRTYAMKQVRYIWPKAGGELLRIVQSTPRPDVIRLALRLDPLALERVDAAIARRQP
jgi:hypothetical protein